MKEIARKRTQWRAIAEALCSWEESMTYIMFLENNYNDYSYDYQTWRYDVWLKHCGSTLKVKHDIHKWIQNLEGWPYGTLVAEGIYMRGKDLIWLLPQLNINLKKISFMNFTNDISVSKQSLPEVEDQPALWRSSTFSENTSCSDVLL